VTGTYIAELRDMDNTRSVSASYTIAVSGTWEKKTIVFPADTTGAFDNDNAASLRVSFGLAFGSNYTSGTLATTWGTLVTANRYVGQTNLSATLNNYFQITGVQLEVGAVATPFEFEDFGVTLAKCQRYYHRRTASAAYSVFNHFGFADSTTNTFNLLTFPVTLRTAPTAVDFSTLRAFGQNTGNYNAITAVTLETSGTRDYGAINLTSTSLTTGGLVGFGANNSSSAFIGFSAEL
jgi:hypothetical protein